MFQRILYEDWQLVFPLVAFVAAVAIFLVMSWRALRMKRAQVDRLARLPLEEDGPASTRHD
jgi:hypothetical protein